MSMVVAVSGCSSVTASQGPATSSDATPVATATPSPRPTPVTVAGAQRVPSAGEISPGRYFMPKGAFTPVTIAFTMPAGWVAENGGQTISKHPDDPAGWVSWSVVTVTTIYSDPCGSNGTSDVGPTADELVQAVAELPGVSATEPTDITLGGRPGRAGGGA